MRKRLLRQALLLLAPIVWRRVQHRMNRGRYRGHSGHSYIHWSGRRGRGRYGNRGRSRFWL
jgi:hypothetical protein